MSGHENIAPGAPFGSENPARLHLEERKAEGSPTVRFASASQEIEPERSLSTLESSVSPLQQIPTQEAAKLKELSKSLQGTSLPGHRMNNHYTFEPVSLPASRVASNESSREASRYNTGGSSNRPSPHQSPRASLLHSPSITPASTSSPDVTENATKTTPLERAEADEDPSVVTPQLSPPQSSRPASSGWMSTRPSRQTSFSNESQSQHHGAFSIGPGTHDSAPTSRDPSPTRSSVTPPYTQPFTPAGDPNDPYAAHKRPPQPRNLDAIEGRFKFSALGTKKRGSSGSLNLPRSSRSTGEVNPTSDKRQSHLFGGHKEHLHDDSTSTLHGKPGSMSDLKRYLKFPGHGHHKSARTGSPTPSTKSGTKTPPHHKTAQQLPFGDDHGLQSRYGKFGKVLGAGAGGSVRLMKRSSDGKMFAVKEFRTRHSYESEKEYAKKVTAEFCVGSTLHHGNIIETLDIVQEKGKWYEVMEYAPYDLFAIVMTGKMSREEVTCSFLQILSGVTYIHSMGLAHRDLKLDNVVVNEFGIMKIIDFGSATLFRYPFETGITLASGIVGSDPYLAPEVYDEKKYDPQPTDIWSLAIIFCCMSLRRFPWKMPRMTDNSYKLFASPPTHGPDMRKLSDKPISPRSENAPANGNANGEAEKKPEVIKGPARLLRLLPRESRHIIGQMLVVDPKERATMEEILADHWISGTDICRQEVGGKVYNAPGHTHTLEGPTPQAPAPAK